MTFVLILKSDTDSAELVSKTQHKDIKLNDVACELWLHELSYSKKIFQPGMVLAKLQLKRKEYPAGMKNIGIPTDIIVDHFRNNVLKVTRDAESVALDYYIYKVIPEYRRDSDANQYVELTCYCYSRDHKLTLNPYSKMYVNKKLVGDMSKSGKEGIMQTEMDGILKKAGFDDKKVDCSNLRFLKYITKPEKKDEKGNVTQHEERKEFIQPYLVQYNESFYDFLARTANRCGEFLYHDKGVLHLGLPVTPEDKVRTINEQTVYAYRYQSFADPVISTAPVYVDGSKLGEAQRGKGQFASGGEGYFYYDELPIDEYLGMVLTKDGFSSFSREFTGMRAVHVEALSNVLTKATLSEVFAAIATAEATAALMANTFADNKNKYGNKQYIKPALSEQKDGDKVCLYGSMLNNDVQGYNYEHVRNLNTKFYQFVSKCSHNTEEMLIEVETGVESPAYYLGEEVEFNGQNCIVISIEEELMSVRHEEVAKGQRLILAPLCSMPVKGGGETTLSLFCPPPMVPFAREVGIQRAFVARNGDPQGLGRVCIRYPWQQASDEPSPWIRMAVPFAPNDAPVAGAGFFFEPKVGDEVVVDYENGNMEHPIITGSLFSLRSPAPSSTRREVFSLKSERDRKIMSEKGHSINFTDTDIASHFLTGFYPGYKLLTTLVSPKWDLHFGEDDSISGGITMCDSWGMYRISASSTDRNISIMSPFGDIKMNAFTGISISAPNGNVRIQGKNVSIEAGNELKLISGANIMPDQSALDYVAEFIEGAITGVVGATVGTLTDFTFFRTAFEVFCKPVAGTMTIHSGRYLLLDAGGARAEIPNKGLSVKGIKRTESDYADVLALTHTIPLVSKLVDAFMHDYVNSYEAVYNSLTTIQTSRGYNTMTSPDKDSLVTKGFNGEEVKKSDMKFDPKVLMSDSQITTLHTGIRTLGSRIQTVYKVCDDFTNGVHLAKNEKGFAYYGKAMKSSLKKCKADLPDYIQAILNKSETFSNPAKTFESTTMDRKFISRMLTVLLITETKVMERNPVEVVKSPIMFSGRADYLNDEKWCNYINQLIPYNALSTANLTTWEAIKKAVMASFPSALKVLNHNFWDMKWRSENELWDSNKQGEILMSDKNGKETVSIVNGVLTRTPNENAFIEQLKDVMLTF